MYQRKYIVSNKKVLSFKTGIDLLCMFNSIVGGYISSHQITSCITSHNTSVFCLSGFVQLVMHFCRTSVMTEGIPLRDQNHQRYCNNLYMCTAWFEKGFMNITKLGLQTAGLKFCQLFTSNRMEHPTSYGLVFGTCPLCRLYQ